MASKESELYWYLMISRDAKSSVRITLRVSIVLSYLHAEGKDKPLHKFSNKSVDSRSQMYGEATFKKKLHTCLYTK